MLTVSQEALVGVLKDADTYNYAKELQSLHGGQVPKEYLNTLELFAYGDYAHYVKYRCRYIDLDKELLLKLVKLTLISVVNSFENTSISIERLLTAHEFQLNGALESFNGGSRETLEEVIIDMVHEKAIDVKIDAKLDLLKIRRAHVLRDAYVGTKTPLLVLKEEDIGTRSLLGGIAYISDWLSSSIGPARAELPQARNRDENEHSPIG